MIILTSNGNLRPLFEATESHLSNVFKWGRVWKRLDPKTYEVRDELRIDLTSDSFYIAPAIHVQIRRIQSYALEWRESK